MSPVLLIMFIVISLNGKTDARPSLDAERYAYEYVNRLMNFDDNGGLRKIYENRTEGSDQWHTDIRPAISKKYVEMADQTDYCRKVCSPDNIPKKVSRRFDRISDNLSRYNELLDLWKEPMGYKMKRSEKTS